MLSNSRYVQGIKMLSLFQKQLLTLHDYSKTSVNVNLVITFAIQNTVLPL